MKLDQLVFGYDGGHRLLAGSRALARDSLSRLLSATDADPGGGGIRIAAGVPLPDDDAYAVAVTWSAPEVPRPGAVWSHALVIAAADLSAVSDPFAIADLTQRPTADAISTYGKAINATLPANSSRPTGASVDLLSRVLAAAYLPDAARRVEVGDPHLAERAISAVWQSQWPQLRGHFWFYTRDTAGSAEPAHGIVLARRLRGARPSRPPSVPPWLTHLASELNLGQQGPVVVFLTSFGPEDRPSKSTVGFLGNLFDAVQTTEVGVVRSLIEDRYDQPSMGRMIKHALFGKGRTTWQINEHDRLDALLASASAAWDFGDLELASRLSKQIRSSGVPAVVTDLHPPQSSEARSAVAEALAREGRPADLGTVLRWDSPTGVALLQSSPHWLEHSESWESLAAEDPALIAAAVEFTPEMLHAAVVGGRSDAVAEAVGIDAVLESIAQARDVGLAKSLLADPVWADAALSSHDDLVVLLAGAAQGERPTDELLEVLEKHRSEPDELWLLAAARAVGAQKRPRNVLKVAFGPLHRSMTENALPGECWAYLDKALPHADDPALRLRRYLVREARSNRWSEADITAALRDSGPFADQLLRDLDDDDDWLTSAVRAVLQTLGFHR